MLGVKQAAHHIAVCACDGCPEMGTGPARFRLGPLPAGATLVRLPCPRAFEPKRILELLLEGAEGVLIVGCAEGSGIVSDYEVEERLKVLRCLLRQVGLADVRIASEWMPRWRWGDVARSVEDLRAALAGVSGLQRPAL